MSRKARILVFKPRKAVQSVSARIMVGLLEGQTFGCVIEGYL